MIRPRRSALYVPGSNARALAKAATLDCDMLILDLEDAVAPTRKVAARDAVVEALARGFAPHQEVLVRINRADADDLAVAARADGVLLPKVEGADEVAWAATSGVPVWCMVETPLGVLRAEAIAASGAAGLVMGTNDLAEQLRLGQTPDRAGLLPHLAYCLLAARAHGCVALDGVHPDVHDLHGLATACAQGRALGFDGKTLIHPSGIATANAAFGSSADELAAARRIVDAWKAASHRGVIVVDGKLVEALHVRDAERVLELEAKIGARHAAAG